MGTYRGNAVKVMADAKKIARKLRKTNVTIRRLMAEYHCAYSTIMRVVLSQMSKEEWKQIRRKILARSGVKTRFQQGMVTWNKGMKGLCFPGSVATQFKAGNIPHNGKKLGTITIRKDKSGQLRMIALPGPTIYRHRWIPYAHYIWEKENGPVPKGRLVVHDDGNRLNDSPDNLILVDRAGHLRHQMESNPNMLKKCRRNASKAAKKRHILYRKQKAKVAKEAAKIREQELKRQQETRRQAERDARAKAMVESGVVVVWWECIGCGFDFTEEPPWKCPKCEGLRFSKITQRKYAKAG